MLDLAIVYAVGGLAPIDCSFALRVVTLHNKRLDIIIRKQSQDPWWIQDDQKECSK